MQRRRRGSRARRSEYVTGLMGRRTKRGTALVLVVPMLLGIVASAIVGIILFFTAFDGSDTPDGYWGCMQRQYEQVTQEFAGADAFCFDPEDPAVADLPPEIRRTTWDERRQGWIAGQPISLFPIPQAS